MHDANSRRNPVAGLAARLLPAVAAVAVARPVAAHSGSVHGGTPHAALLGAFVLGVGVLVVGVRFGHGRWADRPRRVRAGLAVGAVLVTLSMVALTELQVDPLGTDATPLPRGVYPAVAAVAGGALVVASQAYGLLRWRTRPSYTALGLALGLWVAYPVVVPGVSYFNPLGYLLVAAVVVLVGYVLWRDVRPALAARPAGPVPRWTGLTAAALFGVFILFSTGQFTFNPDDGANLPATGFVRVAEFADPLVMWPAVEVYVPSVPFFGALSVGTVVTFALLTLLVGTNATLASAIRLADGRASASRGVLGGVATTGATACCCCAPALWGLTSAAVGASASPLYWALVDPSSPAGSLFFVAAAGLMTASAVELAGSLDAACEPG